MLDMDIMSPIDAAKYVAAVKACEHVQDGMKVGLGTGSTAAWMVRHLAERAKVEDLSLRCVPTSTRTADLARELGLTVTTLEDCQWLDVTIDGADEFDGDLNLIKGGGGALLQEKIVATASDKLIIIADAAKKVEVLGKFPLPVEVIRFGWQTTKALVEEVLVSMDVLGQTSRLRMDAGKPFVTDEGNYIIDLQLERIGNARQLALTLNQVPGVVENGLFVDICDIVIVGHGDGACETFDMTQGLLGEDQIELGESTNLFKDLMD